jgi:hypothetical protein
MYSLAMKPPIVTTVLVIRVRFRMACLLATKTGQTLKGLASNVRRRKRNARKEGNAPVASAEAFNVFILEGVENDGV